MSNESKSELRQAFEDLLQDLVGLLRKIEGDDYKSSADFKDSEKRSPIGGHVRHICDYVEALLSEGGDGPAYDDRQANEMREMDPLGAAEYVLGVERRLLSYIDQADFEKGLKISDVVTVDGARVHFMSTVGRELHFVHSHATHHIAIIGFMARDLGYSLPRDFGKSPSTLRRTAEGP